MRVTAIGERELRVVVSAPADAYVHIVHLALPAAEARLSDNYFDLEPGGRRAVTIASGESALDPSVVTVGWWTARGK